MEDNKKDLNFFVEETIKDTYKSILNVIEDIFVDEIKVNDDKWQRVRSRILDIGNNKKRIVSKLLECCEIKPKGERVVFVTRGDRLVEVINKPL